jgi:DNA-binding beta-propeller fold protein YncE
VGADTEVAFEVRARPGRQGVVKVVGYQLDRSAAGNGVAPAGKSRRESHCLSTASLRLFRMWVRARKSRTRWFASLIDSTSQIWLLVSPSMSRIVTTARCIGGSSVMVRRMESTMPNGQTAPCWVEISRDGRYLFSVNTGSGNLSSFAIGHDGSLTLLATAPFANGAGAVDARLSPDGKTLSVMGGHGLVLSTFALNGATLTELPSSPVPLPAGTSPMGIVVL